MERGSKETTYTILDALVVAKMAKELGYISTGKTLEQDRISQAYALLTDGEDIEENPTVKALRDKEE